MAILPSTYHLLQTELQTEARYNAVRDDLNLTRSELWLMTDNITLTSRLEYLDTVLTQLKTALNRTSSDLAELKSTQTKGKVIYHQTMTPSWLEAHASYIASSRSTTTEQLNFIAGSVKNAALLKVPILPANFLKKITQLTVKIVVANDVTIGTKEDSDTRYGMSDGISFVGFETSDKMHGGSVRMPGVGIEGSSGSSLTAYRLIGVVSTSPSDTFYPGQFVIILKLDARESWGSCYIAHDGGFVKTVRYSKQLALSKGLTLEVYRDHNDERVGIKFIEVTVLEDD